MLTTQDDKFPIGTAAPNFELMDAREGRLFGLNDVVAKQGLVLIFMCNHCPYVKHILPRLKDIAVEYMDKGISFIGINSNDPSVREEDSFENMKKLVADLELPFPYLFDETQEVAKAYGAVCTPDIYAFNKDMELVYRGQFDDTRPDDGQTVTGKSLTAVLDAIILNKEVPSDVRPGVGCNIKWKK